MSAGSVLAGGLHGLMGGLLGLAGAAWRVARENRPARGTGNAPRCGIEPVGRQPCRCLVDGPKAAQLARAPGRSGGAGRGHPFRAGAATLAVRLQEKRQFVALACGGVLGAALGALLLGLLPSRTLMTLLEGLLVYAAILNFMIFPKKIFGRGQGEKKLAFQESARRSRRRATGSAAVASSPHLHGNARTHVAMELTLFTPPL